MGKELKNLKNLPEKSLESELGNPEDTDKKAYNEEDRAFNEAKRIEKSRENFHKMFIWSIWTLWGTSVFLLLIRVWHLIDGFGWCAWLGEMKLSNIDKILIALGSCGIVAKYVQKQLPD